MATGGSPARSRSRRRRGQLEARDPSPFPTGETEVRRDSKGYYGTWCEATIKRANSRRRSVSSKSPMSLVEVSFSDEEYNLGKNTLAEDFEHASVSEMDIPVSALCKSLENTHSPISVISEKNSPQGSHVIVNLVPMNGTCAFAGHSTPVDNQEILSDIVVTDDELLRPVAGRNVDGHDRLSITELRKKKASGHRNSAVTRIQENLAKSLKVKKCISDIKAGKTHPIQELQGKVSLGTKRGSSRNVVSLKILANRGGPKGLCSRNSSLDVTRTAQQRGRKELAEPMEECPLTVLMYMTLNLMKSQRV